MPGAVVWVDVPMAHGQASERLRELQELVEADNRALARDLEAGPSDTSPQPAPFRVSQSGDRPLSWRDKLDALKVGCLPGCSVSALQWSLMQRLQPVQKPC